MQTSEDGKQKEKGLKSILTERGKFVND